MLASRAIIKSAMSKRGFGHRRAENQFSVHGEYVRNLQFVYSKEYATRDGLIVDLIYFAADIVAEKLVIGLYRENAKVENGVYINTSHSISLHKFNADELNKALDKLVPPVRNQVK